MPVTRTGRWVEIVSAVVLSLATIASAWSAYQATRWGGVMSVSFSEASAARVEASTVSARGDAKIALDVGLFTDWLAAEAAGQSDLADFLAARFREEFVTAFDAWLALDPLGSSDAPASPFQMAEYQIAERTQADALYATADQKGQEARDANQNGDNYVLTTVLFASVLFFAGISTKFTSAIARTGTVALAVISFLAGTAIIATFPVY